MNSNRLSRLLGLVLAAVLVLGLVPGAQAYSVTHSTITSTSDDRLDSIRSLMDQQSFPSASAKTKAINAANYLISDSTYAAIGGSKFPYPNSGGYVSTVKDGTYSVTVNAAGCFAYSKFASYVAYKAFGSRLYPQTSSGKDIKSASSLSTAIVKDFFLKYAQAGEHIRLDSVHSMTFLAGDSSGFYYMEYPNDDSPKIRLCYATYENFTAAVKKQGAALWIYNANTQVNGTSAPPSVQFSEPTDSAYTSKASVGSTNAVVVTKVTKPSGVKVTKMGVSLYSSQSSTSPLKTFTENVSNVSNSTTTYHSWYDIQKEVGLTLTPGTTYYYQFFGVFDGTEVQGSRRSFRTTGSAPTPTPTPTPKPTPTPVPTPTPTPVPTPTPTPVPTPTPTPVPTPTPEPSPSYTVTLYNVVNMTTYGTLTVTNGDTWDLPQPSRSGYVFTGWFDRDGREYRSGQTVSLSGNLTLYARFASSTPEETTITLQIGSPFMTINGKRQSIDSLGTTPIARNNRTLLPVRAVVEGLGGTVGWDAANQIVPLTMDGKTLYLQLGSDTAWDSGGDYYALDSEPIALNNRTYLPIRFVVEYFGGEVGWEPDTQTIEIVK